MDNFSYEYYPYICPHLHYLWHKEVLTGKAILDRTIEMQDWLDKSGIVEFRWASEFTQLPTYFNVKQFAGMNFPNTVSLANYIRFKHIEDLLAFRLRWGIHEH